MSGSPTKRTVSLLKQVVSTFPEKRKKLGASIPDEYAQLTVSGPTVSHRVPTFASDVMRSLSPMLKARFDFASRIVRFNEEWLAVDDMRGTMQQKAVRSTHQSLRNHWEGSAPNLYPDDALGLFSMTPGVPENVVYLVWTDDKTEPQLWKYSGMDSRVFKNLNELLAWYIA